MVYELLATMQEFAAFRGVQYDPSDFGAILALEAASQAARSYCGQDFALVEDDEIILDGTGKEALPLPQLPVSTVSSVVENDEELAVDDDYVLKPEVGILYRVWPSRWSYGRQNVVVVYTHGETYIPADVRQAVMEIASRVVAAGSTGGQTVKSETVGAYSIAYDVSGGVVVSVSLSAGDKISLDPYRIPTVR